MDMSVENHETTIRPIHPLWLIPLSIVAGLVSGGPFAGAVLVRCGHRKWGWGLGAGGMLLGGVLLLLAGLWGVRWYWVGLTVSLVHLACGTALFLIVRKPYQAFQASHPSVPLQQGSYRSALAGMVGGGLLGALFGTVFAIPYVLLSDSLFSTVMPVDFDDGMVLYRIFSGAAFLTISGFLAGGFLGRFRPGLTAAQAILYALFLVWAHHTWMLGMDTAISMPAFQAHSATLGGWRSLVVPLFFLQLFIGCWWTVFLLFFTISPSRLSLKFLRAGFVLGMNLTAAITISIMFGYSADLLLGMGEHFERTGRTSLALWCYERGLDKEPKEQVASYLQYRAALSSHRLGQEEKARAGLNRVVAKFTGNEELVKKANRFLDSMERKPEGKRVVLPGVETRTEYKGGYCVPNSLALVMRYWGKDISARVIGSRITGLGRGTIVVDQRWFAEQEGMRHDFLPMAGIDDIKHCIDAGFPVLVYVPAHVFAIVGYDEVLETFVTYDVATADIWEEYIQTDFIKSWKRQATTLVLSYPPEKESLIPEDIRHRLESLSDNYLHFQLHYFDAPGDSLSIPHLYKAAGDNGAFFFPVTVLYGEFPGLRPSLGKQYDATRIAGEIRDYFWNDFDEGIHEAGQHHDERWARPDWALEYAVSYLINNQRFDMVEALISRINDQRQVSEQMLAGIGLLDLSRGELERGLDRIRSSQENSASFYAGLARLKMGNIQGATQDLVKTVERRA